MWIVRLALRRPYTFVVMAMLVLILGVVSILRMPTDIFPDIDIPVISVIFNYSGMSADDMDKRVVANFERFLTTTVNDIEHIESQSLYGIGVIKVFFQKNAKIEAATAQITAVSQTAIRQMPPGMTPPLVIRYSASNVPILQLSLGSPTMSEQQLFDAAVNVIRPKLVTIPGLQLPYPYGGKQRQIMVDLDPKKLYAYGLSPADVSSAVNAQNLILPAGTAKVGSQEYQVRLNSSPDVVDALNDLPVKTVDGTTVYVRDVAHVRDGFSVQTNVVHSDGKRGVLISILKSGGASTLDVVRDVQAALPGIQATLPKDLEINLMFDQSLFVRAAVEGVVTEAGIAAGLTGLMILLFLGSWRSTLIVVVSIPLSILVSIIVLASLGQTLNVMTLGGMALAVGILVDDATVEIENIHRNLHQRKRLVTAILDGASQIAVPAFVSTLCICIVFVPVVFISGAAKYLFTPLAMAVVFAMMTSYLLSRTLVPTMVHYLLAAEVDRYGGVPEGDAAEKPAKRSIGPRIALAVVAAALVAAYVALRRVGASPDGAPAWAVDAGTWVAANDDLFAKIGLGVVGVAAAAYVISALDLIWRTHHLFNRGFEALRSVYGGFLAWALEHRIVVTAAFAVLVAVSCALIPQIGRDFFPSVDAGQIRLHVRAPAGTRIEETAKRYASVEEAIRATIPPREVVTVLDNIGIPNSGINLSLSDGSVMSPADGEILVALSPDHAPTETYVKRLRRELPERFPDLVFFFQPPDIATQVLSFGLPAPVDVQISGPGRNGPQNEAIARAILEDVRRVPGVVDARMQQVVHAPDVRVDVDRSLAAQMGVSQRDVAGDLLISLSSSTQTAPNFWMDPKTGVNYSILVQTPQYAIPSTAALLGTPVPSAGAGGGSVPHLLADVARVGRGATPTNTTHYDISPTFDVLLGVSGSDLGSVADGVRAVVEKRRAELPRGSTINLRGQIQSMDASFGGLAFGLAFSIVLVYLLMAINFQSWLDPLIILMALPGALSGIAWMLFVTGTTISVPALMGAMMSIGVATANSILMITFANDQRIEGLDAKQAALAAGLTRLRPVVMTALAMIIGMLPMSLGLSEGGEQNAPLGRAVIGGLALATFTTLFFVPVVYSALRGKAPRTAVEEELR
jgi:multidrug efflux pump subunit AcrB